MIFPYSDDNSSRRIQPIITYLLIALNIFVFIVLQKMDGSGLFTYQFSTVPKEILDGVDIVTRSTTEVHPASGQQLINPGLGVTPIPVYLTMLSSMFMHGGWMHLGGNMLYLWIFGDNIENELGHLKYILFYLLCGVIASLAHVYSTHFLGGNTMIASLGASGSISGIMGAYLLLYPKNKVNVLVFFRFPMVVPAFIALGIWIGMQLFSSLSILGGKGGDGIAYAAHIGGFIAGLVLVKLFALGNKQYEIS
jgi:membrane associated rhomboid family serine protease